MSGALEQRIVPLRAACGLERIPCARPSRAVPLHSHSLFSARHLSRRHSRNVSPQNGISGGALPLDGALPDMTSTTDAYLGLQVRGARWFKSSSRGFASGVAGLCVLRLSLGCGFGPVPPLFARQAIYARKATADAAAVEVLELPNLSSWSLPHPGPARFLEPSRLIPTSPFSAFFLGALVRPSLGPAW